MNDDFYRHLFEKPNHNKNVPPNKAIAHWALNVIGLLYPEVANNGFADPQELKTYALGLQRELREIICLATGCASGVADPLSERFFDELPELYRTLNTDIQSIYEGDPAAHNEFEVVRTYPGFFAICFYRMAHILSDYGVPLVPRILTEYAHSKTGIDIHPAAQIGEYFYIDHGTGIVIGETTVIGNHVKLYQGVTLGALSVHKHHAGSKRHPTVEDHVVIYSGATILGGDTVIGHDCTIGGNVWLTQSIAPYSTVYHSPNINVRTLNELL
ncbi:serine acetyltransferase [Mucilaginibacter sp. PAMC 26640]|nr:serine acetyltransferase [Mucilaginibacter sp. PAMC 26640]